MEETPQGAGAPAPTGEATPSASPAVNPEAGASANPGVNPTNPSGNQPGTSNYVPYERFKEVNEELKGLKAQFEGLSPQLETVNRLQSAFAPQEQDINSFETPQDFINHMSGKFEKEWEARETALKQEILSSVNARQELESLKADYPELKEDKDFRDIVVSQIAANPNRQVRDIVTTVKKYMDAATEKARKVHEEEFLAKGTYSGRSNNQPYEAADADEVRKSITGAGRKGGIF